MCICKEWLATISLSKTNFSPTLLLDQYRYIDFKTLNKFIVSIPRKKYFSFIAFKD